MSAAAINPKVCTTFRLLRQYGACIQGYRKLAQHIRDQHGQTPEDYGMDRPIELLTVLGSNGIADAAWCLRATQEPSQLAQLFALDCAEHLLPIFEKRRPNDNRPREAIRITRLFLQGKATREEWMQARKGAAYADAADAYADADAYAYAYAAYAYAAYAADAYADAAYAAYAYAAYAADAYADAAAAAYAYAAYADAAYADARLAERQWQADRLKAMIAAICEPAPPDKPGEHVAGSIAA